MARLIVGLGNPGAEHAGNRHNIGFMAVERIHDRHGFPPWRTKFRAEVSDGTLGGVRVTLMKPMTYMNLSGESVGEAARFFKVDPADVVVVHDEIDLLPGRFRVKTGGGSGGHNGLRSITSHIGDGYRRLRLGVGHPGAKDAVPRYVLKDFAKADADWLEPLLDAVAAEAPLLAGDQDSTFANRVHLALGGGRKKADGPKAGRKPQKAKAEAPAAGAPDEAGEAPTAAPARPAPAAPAAEESSPFAALKRLIRRP